MLGDGWSTWDSNCLRGEYNAIYFWNVLPGIHGTYPYQNQPTGVSLSKNAQNDRR